MLTVSSLSVGFRNGNDVKTLLEELSFTVEPGSLWAIIGRNGVGKTTLLKSITGMQQSLEGTVALEGTPLLELSANLRARKMAIVTTERINLGYLTVKELVALGRHPYTGFWGYLHPKDKEAVDHAIKVTEIESLQNKTIDKLSDGEHQKVMIARALAQETPILFLDEPTAHLDLVNRIGVFKLLKRLATEHGRTVVFCSHELDLALQSADHIVLLDGSLNAVVGTPDKLRAEGHIKRVFNLSL